MKGEFRAKLIDFVSHEKSMFPSTFKSGLYLITCIPLQKHYVGESKNVPSRLSAHKSRLRRGIHENQELQNDFHTYGEKAFLFQKLLVGSGVAKPERELLEVRILETLPRANRYNFYTNWRKREAITNAFFGKQHTLEARQAQSSAKKGKASPFAGHTQTNRVKDLVRRANTGKSDKRKSLFIDDVFYESLSQASVMTGLNRKLLRERCNSQEPRFTNSRWSNNSQS